MLELIEIVRHGLPLSELRTWLFFAALAASGIAGWYSLNVIEDFKNKKAEEQMNAVDRLTSYYSKFMALPFFTRRAIIFVASLVLWWFAAMLASMHVNNDLCVVLLLTGAAGALWSSGLWRMWKVFAIIVAVCLAIMR